MQFHSLRACPMHGNSYVADKHYNNVTIAIVLFTVTKTTLYFYIIFMCSITEDNNKVTVTIYFLSSDKLLCCGLATCPMTVHKN